MEVKKKRLTLDLEPTFQRRLKVVAALKGVTMRHYCYTAIDKELAQDETQGFSSPVSSWSDAERFEELQKKYFGTACSLAAAPSSFGKRGRLGTPSWRG